jgi:hypothetical protein
VHYESSGVKQKVILEAIGHCLASKDEFRSDVVREALAELLKDELPAQALMRTAILSVQVRLRIRLECDGKYDWWLS